MLRCVHCSARVSVHDVKFDVLVRNCYDSSIRDIVSRHDKLYVSREYSFRLKIGKLVRRRWRGSTRIIQIGVSYKSNADASKFAHLYDALKVCIRFVKKKSKRVRKHWGVLTRDVTYSNGRERCCLVSHTMLQSQLFFIRYSLYNLYCIISFTVLCLFFHDSFTPL